MVQTEGFGEDVYKPSHYQEKSLRKIENSGSGCNSLLNFLSLPIKCDPHLFPQMLQVASG